MEQNNSTSKTQVSQVGYNDIVFRRNQAYSRGYSDGADCKTFLDFPTYAEDVIAYVQGFITGTYDRVHYNSGDYLTF
jgi:hypothetical protein